MSNEFIRERTDLAAVLRWAAREGMQEAAGNHCSLSVSENGSRFLINPDGRYFSGLAQAQSAGEIAADQNPAELAGFISAAWEGALLRMKADRQIGPLRVFIQQLERLLQP